MKVEKVNVDGKEMDFVIDIDKDDIDYILPNDELEDTMDLDDELSKTIEMDKINNDQL